MDFDFFPSARFHVNRWRFLLNNQELGQVDSGPLFRHLGMAWTSVRPPRSRETEMNAFLREAHRSRRRSYAQLQGSETAEAFTHQLEGLMIEEKEYQMVLVELTVSSNTKCLMGSCF